MEVRIDIKADVTDRGWFQGPQLRRLLHSDNINEVQRTPTNILRPEGYNVEIDGTVITVRLRLTELFDDGTQTTNSMTRRQEYVFDAFQKGGAASVELRDVDVRMIQSEEELTYQRLKAPQASVEDHA